jgi:6-phosphogluconolactonase
MLKKAATLVLVCASVSAWLGCGTTKSRFLYAAIPSSNTIVAYREDPNAGVLTQLAGSPISAGSAIEALAMHPSGKYLYAANSGSNNISEYTISSTGALTEVTPRTATGTAPTLLAIDSAGTFLYAVNSGESDISVFSIGSNGSLSPVLQCSGNPNCQTTTAPIGLLAMNLALAPSGNFLYVTSEESPSGAPSFGVIEAFPVNQGVIGPLPVTNSPFVTGNNPLGLAIDSTGSHLYTANKTDNSISAFTINSDGSLAPLGSAIGESFTSPISLLIDRSGKFLYVANQGSSNIAAYSIGSDGGLTLLSASPFTTGSQPNVLASDSSGKFFFVGYSSAIQAYTLSSGGSLTSIATYSVSATPSSIVITP